MLFLNFFIKSLTLFNGKKYEIVETLAEDFGDFILQLVQEQVED